TIDPLVIRDFNEPMHVPSCTDAPFYILGLSMAGWNGVIAGVMAVASFVAAGATWRGAVRPEETA
ncbi:MAG TPA: hypothetical protein DDX09_01590, partial [Hyphomonas atlantica]|nr:hypothetical protein [Hyphomonas atlantica]